MKNDSARLQVSYGRRAASYWFVDGLPEILFGGTLVILDGLAFLWRVYVPKSLIGLDWLVVYLGLILYFFMERGVLDFLKWHITYPRTGYVQPPEETEGSHQTLTTLSLRPASPAKENVTFFRRRMVTTICLFLILLIPGNPLGRWLVPVVMPVLAAILYASNRTSERPYRWWSALILALTGLPFVWVAIPAKLQGPTPFLLAGGWFVAQGLCTLLNYLRVNPYPRHPEGVRA